MTVFIERIVYVLISIFLLNFLLVLSGCKAMTKEDAEVQILMMREMVKMAQESGIDADVDMLIEIQPAEFYEKISFGMQLPLKASLHITGNLKPQNVKKNEIINP